jgi:hypothetical protein
VYFTEPTVIYIVLNFCCNILRDLTQLYIWQTNTCARLVLCCTVPNIALPPVFSVNNLKFRQPIRCYRASNKMESCYLFGSEVTVLKRVSCIYTSCASTEAVNCVCLCCQHLWSETAMRCQCI